MIFEDPPDDTGADNERLEFLGDSVLLISATILIHNMFPYLRAGPAARIRSIVLSNRTFAGITLQYGLLGGLRCDSNAASLKASTKVQADLFEAWIGGIYIDKGMDAAREFVFKVLEPHVHSAYQEVRKHYGGESGLIDTLKDSNVIWGSSPTIYLHQCGDRLGWAPLYSFYNKDPSPSSPSWEVIIKVDGETVGIGRAASKKMAQDEAAINAIFKLKLHDAPSGDSSLHGVVIGRSPKRKPEGQPSTKSVKKRIKQKLSESWTWEQLLNEEDLESHTAV